MEKDCIYATKTDIPWAHCGTCTITECRNPSRVQRIRKAIDDGIPSMVYQTCPADTLTRTNPENSEFLETRSKFCNNKYCSNWIGENPMNRDVNDFFDSVNLISLSYREDRKKAFFDQVETCKIPWKINVYNAISGDKTGHADFWTAGDGAWGCYRSHYNLLEQAINENKRNVLFLEDDALFVENFMESLQSAIDELPEDWDFFYLGGQHRFENQNPPTPVSKNLCKAFSVNRTHAYAINAKAFSMVYKHLSKFSEWKNSYHIDHHYERLHREAALNVYATIPWLVGQSAGSSNISGHTDDERFWNNDSITSVLKPVCDGVSVQYSSVAYGKIGLNGKLGYENKSVEITGLNDKIHTISAHTPSRVVLKTDKTIYLFGAINGDCNPWSTIDCVVDDSTLGTISKGNAKTKPVELPPGTHVLEFRAKDNRQAHSVWCFSMESIEQDDGIKLRNGTIIVKEHTVGYGDLGVNGDLGYEGKRVQMQGLPDGIEWISAHAPSKLVIETTEPLYVFGAIDESTSSVEDTFFARNKNIWECAFLLDGERIGGISAGGFTTMQVRIEPGLHTLETVTGDAGRTHSIWGFSTPAEIECEQKYTTLGIAVVAVGIEESVKKRFRDNIESLGVPVDIEMIESDEKEDFSVPRLWNVAIKNLIRRRVDTIVLTDVDMIVSEDLLAHTQNTVKHGTYLWNPCVKSGDSTLEIKNLRRAFSHGNISGWGHASWIAMTGLDWQKSCGFNEDFIGYGFFDNDIHARLAKKHVKIRVGSHPIVHLNHKKRERNFLNTSEKSMEENKEKIGSDMNKNYLSD